VTGSMCLHQGRCGNASSRCPTTRVALPTRQTRRWAEAANDHKSDQIVPVQLLVPLLTEHRHFARSNTKAPRTGGVQTVPPVHSDM
jgi:hypothetical protein